MEKTDKFEWTDEQCDALDMIRNWKEFCENAGISDEGDDNQIFRLFGYAGTGKTSIVKEIASQANGAVLFCAFTGKAASVMQKMGCTGACTIHSAIYRPLSELIKEAKDLRAWIEDRPKVFAPDLIVARERHAMEQWGTINPRELQERLSGLRDRIEEGPKWVLRDKIDPEPDLVIVDECSMVGRDLALDLLSFGHPVLVIGDPGQLPPVKGAGFFIDAEPDAMLREVHRFALENPITRIATTVRMEGARELRLGEYGESRYLSRAIVDSTDMLVEADQVLCGMHRTRHTCNAAIREALGFSGPIPLPGEKLLCDRNSKLHRLLNGTLWRVKSCEPDGSYLKAVIEPYDEDGAERKLVMHADPFAGRKILPEDEFDAEMFDWGYAITCHRAQGSQWPHVAVINDGFGSWVGGSLQDQWLYTAVTRAQERLTIIKPEARRARGSGRDLKRFFSEQRT